MINLIKSLLVDIIYNGILRAISYIYWNYRDVRINLSSRISIDAKLGKKCSFIHYSIITSDVTIGEYSYGSFVQIQNADIGSYCSIAPGVKIGLDEHDINNFSTHPSTYDGKLFMSKIGKTNIGSHVWIGANAVILSGVITQ